VDHPALDGPGADDRDLDDEVVEAARGVAGERGHLRAALHLEEPHRVGLVQDLVDGRVERDDLVEAASRDGLAPPVW
jgi:hypothetical protein